MRCGRKKGSNSLTQASTHLSLPRQKILRDQRKEAMEEEESSHLESELSDQGEAVTTEALLRPDINMHLG